MILVECALTQHAEVEASDSNDVQVRQIHLCLAVQFDLTSTQLLVCWVGDAELPGRQSSLIIHVMTMIRRLEWILTRVLCDNLAQRIPGSQNPSSRQWRTLAARTRCMLVLWKPLVLCVCS